MVDLLLASAVLVIFAAGFWCGRQPIPSRIALAARLKRAFKK